MLRIYDRRLPGIFYILRHMKTKVDTDRAPRADGLLSQAVVHDGLVYVAGQVHNLPDGTMVQGTIAEKTEQVMKNLQAVLEAAGTDLDHVLKATLYITDMSYGPDVNAVYKRYIAKEPLPAREMVCVSALPLGADVEISLTAALPMP